MDGDSELVRYRGQAGPMELFGQCVLDGANEQPRGELVGLALLPLTYPPRSGRVMPSDEMPELMGERASAVDRAKATAAG